MLNENNLKKIVKVAIFIFVGLILSKLISYILRIVLARGLGTTNYGLFNLGIAVTGMLSVLGIFGLNDGLIRYFAYYRGKEDKERMKSTFYTVLVLSLIFSFILFIVLFFFSGFISNYFFSDPNLTIVLKLLSITIPLIVVTRILMDSLRANQQIKYIFYAEFIINSFTRLAFVSLAIYLGYGLFGATLAYALSFVAFLILSIYYVRTKIKFLFDKSIEYQFMFKKLFSYSWPLLLTALLYYLINWVDSIIIGYFKTSDFVGIYNSAAPTAGLVRIFPVALTYLFLPIIAGFISKGENIELKNLFSVVNRWIFTISLPLTILLIVFSKQVIGIFFGSNYLPATMPLIILAVGQLIFALSITSGEILKSIKKTKYLLGVNIIAILSNIFLNFYLIPIYGITGAAIATTSSYLVRSLLIFAGNYSRTKLIPFNKEHLKPIFISIILIYPLIYLSNLQQGLFTVIWVSLLFLILYSLLFLLFKGLKQEDYMLYNSVKDKLIHFSHISQKPK